MSLEHNDWKGTTGGLPWMQRTLIRWLSVVDQRIIYAVLTVVVPFYMLLGHKGYVAMYAFFHRVMGEPWWKAFCHVYANHFRFGQVVIDRFAAFGGREFRFEVDDAMWQNYMDLANADEGFLQLSCHMGNYELAGYLLKQPKKSMHALVFEGETQTMMQNRAKMFAPKGVEMVAVMSDMSHIFALNNALRDGNVASMPGDRIFGSPKSIDCTVLGRRVKLPLGPFHLAVARDVKVMAVWVMKVKYDTYRVYCYELKDDPSATKRDRCQMLADDFARHMDEVVSKHPTQWFNYFDFFSISDNSTQTTYR